MEQVKYIAEAQIVLTENVKHARAMASLVEAFHQ